LCSYDGNSDSHSIHFGVAGAGYWGANLIRVCADLGVLDSVCDHDAVATASVRSHYPAVQTVSSFDELLARPIDGVVIATPAHLHAEMSLAAIRAGKNVFVEKPLALSVDDGERIADAAQAANRIVFVGHLLLYHPAIRKMLSLIADGKIGRIWHLRTRRMNLGKLRQHENVWWSFAPHDVALMLVLMGSEPSSVIAAQAGRQVGGLSDAAYADFEFANGRSAHVEVCWLDPEKCARVDVFGDSGVITLHDSRRGGSLLLRRFSVTSGSTGMPAALRGDETEIDFEDQEPLKAEILAFIEALRSGKSFPSTARQGVAVLRALSLAEQSLDKRNPLKALA
jgi:UDP-2-acetamido-3-amino-2,3-dideoxy-glucuronate N-acetyltransferase